jgi:predicted PolB exonuclease-like 3'-5' exonuclease
MQKGERRHGMSKFAIIWDLETIPDLPAFKRMCGNPDMPDAEAEELMGDKFAKLPLHLIACIGAVVAERGEWGWRVVALGAPHIGQRSEAEIIGAFVDRLEELRPQLVAFNGHGFDLPVLRYRAMVHTLSAPGLNCRSYFNRYSEDCLDLCDALASYDARSKMKLDALCRVLGLPGKPEGIDGSQVGEFVKQGRIQEVADYCETDVVNTYRVFLRYELFRGNITPEQHEQSEADVEGVLRAKVGEKPHLASLLSS